jgi:hypothetical protein
MELESALIKALSQSTPNRYKIEAQISSEIEYGYVSPRLPELTDSMCNSGGK